MKTNEELIQDLHQTENKLTKNSILNQLIIKNLPLIKLQFNKIKNILRCSNQERDDFIQIGSEQIVKCAYNFNPDLDNKFSTYLGCSVYLAMMRYFNISDTTVRTSVHLKERIHKVKNKLDDGEVLFEDLDSRSQSAVRNTKYSYIPINDMPDWNPIFRKLSYTNKDQYDNIIYANQLMKIAKKVLSKQEYFVLLERAKSKSLTDARKKFKLSRQRIEQIEKEAIRKLKRQLNLLEMRTVNETFVKRTDQINSRPRSKKSSSRR